MAMTSEMKSERVGFGKIAQATAVAGVGSAVANSVVWFIGNAIAGLKVPLAEVLVFSLIGALGGGIVYALLVRFTRKPNTIFIAISAIVLVVYALGPISAAMAPYMQGAEIFDTATVVAAELMHLISAAFVVGFLTRLTPAKPSGYAV